jgi:anti-sigma regulatory factor (Ser/Thr protein kinase)
VNSLQARNVYCGSGELGPPNSAPPQGVRECRIALAAAPESTRIARDFTSVTLRRWQQGALIGDATVVASELVTNAIRHGTGLPAGGAEAAPVGLAWHYLPHRLVCVVTDRSHRPPVLVLPGLDAECGRGLQIVQALTAAWGWTMLGPQEKAVWAALEPLGQP